MNAREAKRHAYRIAATVLREEATHSEDLTELLDDDGNERPDAARIRDALLELSDELWRRSEGRGKGR